MTEQSSQVKYRHEYKYLINSMESAVLKTRVRFLLKSDVHTKETGSYRIRSLYFDSPGDDCYYENESGIGERDKYRIRIYNEDARRIILEKKSKNRQMTLKHSCSIDKSLCRKLMNREQVQITSDMSAELQKMLLELQKKVMRPVVIVEYQRYPFVEANGNVRVTFDEMICSSNDISGFLEKNIVVRPFLPKGMSVLEVKWDEFLPDYIKNHMQMDSLQWCSFSKYYLCRKYNTYGGIRI